METTLERTVIANPLHVLRHEHRVIEQFLRALNGICLRIKLGEEVGPGSLAGVLEFTSNFIDKFHHDKEERYLFPALIKGGLLKEPLELMTAEHQAERKLTEELRSASQAYRRGDPAAIASFVEAGLNYSNHLLGHMEREDRFLFPLADELLSEAEKDSLMNEFKRTNAELRCGEKYEKIAKGLEARWSI